MKANKSAGVKTRLQIADEYEMSYSTFWRKVKSHRLKLPPGLISPYWQKIIYEAFGYPDDILPDDNSQYNKETRHERF